MQAVSRELIAASQLAPPGWDLLIKNLNLIVQGWWLVGGRVVVVIGVVFGFCFGADFGFAFGFAFALVLVFAFIFTAVFVFVFAVCFCFSLLV